MENSRLTQQIAFVAEVDKLKDILRRSLVTASQRPEDSAEHSWHLALMAIVLEEYAAEPVDLIQVLRMLLVHDLVEIDAGDTFAYDITANQDRADREERAAERIFGLLPTEQREELRELWEEFEAASTPESRYANALDRLQPLLQNSRAKGVPWREHGVCRDQVMTRMEPVRTAMPALWPTVVEIIETGCREGHIKP